MMKFLPSAIESKKEYPANGFTLVELMVVLVVIGILATGIIMMFSNPVARVKAAAFEIRGDFNLAKAVSVKENENVLISFEVGANDGYRVCFDTNDNGDCYDETGDDVIKDVVFRDRVTFYNFAGGEALPSNGPDKAPAIGGVEAPLASPSNGITFAGPAIEFQSNGTCDQSGTVIIYLPLQGSPSSIKGKPYALVVESASSGRVRLMRWRQDYTDSTPHAGDWSRK